MYPCRFTYPRSPVFVGYTDGTKTRVGDNVSVTPAVRDEIASWFVETYPGPELEDSIHELRAAEPGPNGLIPLNGHNTRILRADSTPAAADPPRISFGRDVKPARVLTPALLRRLAAVMFGDDWFPALAGALGADTRTLERLLAGHNVIPRAAEDRLQGLLREHDSEAARVCGDLLAAVRKTVRADACRRAAR